MKKLFVSVGLIAAGTASLQAAYAPDTGPMSASKAWTVSGTLRGFYDDNYQTSADSKGSFGFELSPQVGINLALQQTELGARYTFGSYYYEERDHLGQDPWDYTHQFDFWLDHAFTERWQARAQDTFVVGQEPELIGGGQVTRVEGNNIRNTGNLSVNTVLTRLFSTQLGYGNTFYLYENDNGDAADPSLAGKLNRMEQSVSLDLQWIVAPETLAFIGAMYGWVDYTGDEPIASSPTGGNYNSDTRNSRSYFGYIGLQRSMLANLSFSGRAGFQYTDYYNDPQNTSSVYPYADLSLVYTYLPGCYAQLGFTETQIASDQVQRYSDTKNITVGAQSSTAYASLNHKITPRLMGTVIGRWQHSIYNGGSYDGNSDDYFSLGVNLNYYFTPHFSAEAGYNLDNLQSDVPNNNYTRNRVYLGVSATY